MASIKTEFGDSDTRVDTLSEPATTAEAQEETPETLPLPERVPEADFITRVRVFLTRCQRTAARVDERTNLSGVIHALRRYRVQDDRGVMAHLCLLDPPSSDGMTPAAVVVATTSEETAWVTALARLKNNIGYFCDCGRIALNGKLESTLLHITRVHCHTELHMPVKRGTVAAAAAGAAASVAQKGPCVAKPTENESAAGDDDGDDGSQTEDDSEAPPAKRARHNTPPLPPSASDASFTRVTQVLAACGLQRYLGAFTANACYDRRLPALVAPVNADLLRMLIPVVGDMLDFRAAVGRSCHP